ncbi:beta-N-acetylhexosaminidase [Natronorubrum sp. JWXQ-INN-674]|uniref:Beta-N-acetylhexosaminidase n=1 Tax=Natronorubrum halalkaliphilum TaxID=2691917 RepID=A0A6B0VG77_9EURY|nr:beta-N-acetylhexosaminidase [Natronorubrum halalkaliphilum]MXV60490.1 beta-N-acetylhexosaminidase [Natronorubrum halalkaliphilum]
MTEPPLSTLSLEQKVGQLFHVGFPETEPTPALEELICDYHVGGVIYFSRNLETPEQTRSLSKALQQRALDSGAEIPLLLSVDQEGGTVRRLPYGTDVPGQMAVGATETPVNAATVARVTAKQLRDVGINFNLAPVLDVNNNPENPVIGVRSYSEDAETVATFGTRYFETLQSESVVACGKHFPGHGDTATDSHAELPVVDAHGDRLEEVELRPFARAIEAGIDAIMTAHVAFPAITGSETKPATLSPAVLTDLLRDELGFTGVLTTDCMEMNAIAETVGTARGAVEAIAAGADVVLVSHSPDKQRRAIERVIDAVERGEIAETRIDESVRRILTLKSNRDLQPAPLTESGSETVITGDDRVALRTISRDAVTLLRGNLDTRPIDPNDQLHLIAPAQTSGSPAAESQSAGSVLESLFEKRDVDTRLIEIGSETDLKTAVPTAAQVLCCTADVARNPEQATAVEALRAAGHSPVVAALTTPYDCLELSQVEPVLTTYDPTLGNLTALVDVLLGEQDPRGTPPTSLRSD